MITKNEFIRNNLSVINKEFKETLELLKAPLTEKGYYKDSVSFDLTVADGVIIYIAKKLTEDLELLGWIANISYHRQTNSLSIEVK